MKTTTKSIIICTLLSLVSVGSYIGYKTWFPTDYVCVQEIEYKSFTDRNVIRVHDHGVLGYSYQQDGRTFSSGIMKTQTDPTYGSADISETPSGTYMRTQRGQRQYYMHLDTVAKQEKRFSQCDKK